MKESTPYLFVYGTLRSQSGHPMSVYLARGSHFLGFGKTPGRLYDLGSYPGLLPAESETDWVRGELYELHDPEAILAQLDEYEGCTHTGAPTDLFRRDQATVILDDGRSYRSWIYYYCRPVQQSQRILIGDYYCQESNS